MLHGYHQNLSQQLFPINYYIGMWKTPFCKSCMYEVGYRTEPFTNIQWNPSKMDTIGGLIFILCKEVSLVKRCIKHKWLFLQFRLSEVTYIALRGGCTDLAWAWLDQ